MAFGIIGGPERRFDPTAGRGLTALDLGGDALRWRYVFKSASRPLTLKLNVNGADHEVEADLETPLLQVLRNELGLTAAKYGCGVEQCYACAVLVDGEARPSCASPVGSFEGRRVVTVEGLADGAGLTPIQRAFIAEEAAQCGYCIPGMVIGATALLERNPRPDEAAVRQAMDPHLCRCGTHPRIVRAVLRAAQAQP